MPAGYNVPDIRLVQNNQFPQYSVTVDWSLLPDGTLDDTQALATAVIIALGTNALAGNFDPLPDPDSNDRMGWWGDLDAELIWNGWPIGSKLWLLQRSKITPAGALYGSTQAAVENYIRDAIQPFVDRKICSSFAVWTTRVNPQRIDALIRIYRGPAREIDLRYAIIWDDLVNRKPPAAPVAYPPSVAVGSAAGVSDVYAIASSASSIGAAEGYGDIQAIARSFVSVGYAAGIVGVTGIGQTNPLTVAIGSATSVSTVSGIASSASSIGAASGTGNVQAKASSASSIGAAPGIGTITGIAGSRVSIGAATGIVTITGIARNFISVGAAAGMGGASALAL